MRTSPEKEASSSATVFVLTNVRSLKNLTSSPEFVWKLDFVPIFKTTDSRRKARVGKLEYAEGVNQRILPTPVFPAPIVPDPPSDVTVKVVPIAPTVLTVVDDGLFADALIVSATSENAKLHPYLFSTVAAPGYSFQTLKS